MRIAKLQILAVVLVLLTLAGSAFGQHNWKQTVTVDPNLGAADHQTIQAAINDPKIGNNPSVRYTVLIFAGTYTENVTLGGMKENVDLVGIDREAVIIKPSNGDGILITSGTETSRNNRIANLTIKTTTGHGIKIVKGTAVPKDIEIVGVTILAAGTFKQGFEGGPADTVRIFDCNIESDAGHGVVVGDNYQIVSSSMRSGAAAGEALKVVNTDGLLVSNCTLTSDWRGLVVDGDPPPLNIQVVSSEIRGGFEGMYLSTSGANIRFRNCYIVAEGNSSSHTYAVYQDHGVSGSDVVFQGCRIDALGSVDTDNVRCIQGDNTPDTQFIDCDFRAVCLNDEEQATVYGISNHGGPLIVIGGSITTSQPDFDKAIDVFDLVGDVPSSTPDHIFISGTRFSKWIGPVNAAGRPRSVTQRTIGVSAALGTAIHAAMGLTGSEQEITTGISNPDVYRVLSVTGNELDMAQDVYIIGTDWADNDITEKITLSGTNTIKGFKPFRTVTKIILPAQNDAGETVTVGTTNILGLYYPIASTSDVLQQGRKASDATSYTLQSVGTVDVTYSTVDIGLVAANDSLEWALLASQ